MTDVTDVTDRPGLRERKKLRTHAAISDAAIALFLEHGFDHVSVSQVAEAAEVSRRTLFAYFPAKEDLVVHRFADHETEGAETVRGRPPGVAPLAALHAHFLDALRRRDPVSGLNDQPHIRALLRMVFETPALAWRLERFKSGAERALARALAETAGVPVTTARLMAVQIAAVHWALTRDNAERLAYGESADERYPGAVADAELAFELLEHGIGPMSRPGS